jgi:hypothetical protein
MSRHTVNIELRASGGTKTAGEMGKVGKASTDLVANIKKLGNVFGELGGNIGGILKNILKGGIWGIMAEVASGIVSLGKKAWDTLKKAEKETQEAQARVIATQARGLENLAAAQRNAAAAREAAIKSAAESYKKELDAVHDLTKANLELAKAQARARGDVSAVASIEKKMGENDSATRRKLLERNLSDAMKRLESADMERSAARALSASSNAFIRQLRAERPKTGLKDENTRARYDSINKAIMSSAKTRNNAEKTAEAAEQKGSAAWEDVKNARRALAAFDKAEAARRINAEQDEIDKAEAERKKEAEDIKKFEAEKKRLEKSIAAERRKLQIEAAKERERLDREAHQKRMADLRDEIAKQKEVAAPLRTVAAAAQSEFDRAFAMYRDPSRAAAEIGEEKDYQNDLERLHRDARQYGGKWRIDELSRLMSGGDTQGVTDALNSWRKTKGFTPEIEAMVRASAAEKTKTTAEDELRKVNDKVASMSDVLKQMADSQSGKLGTIADSTSGLAEKIDQLLKVKG